MTFARLALRTALTATVLAALPGLAAAQMSHQHTSEAACEEALLRCATKVTPAFGPDGTLWLAWMAGGRISVASSKDQGKSFSTSVQVTEPQLDLDWGPDARPKIAVDARGGIALAFSIFRDKAFNGQVLITRSTDGGRSFAPPKPITANNASQRFEAIGFDPAGTVFAAWLDKRNRAPAQQNGQTYDGAALFFATSRDGGETYSDARIVADNTCECCRLGLAFDGNGHPVVAFRNIFEGGVRDHAIVTFADLGSPGEVHRVSRDDWQIAACPHHGPSLTISPEGTYHVTWYTNGKARKGLFYAQSRDGGKTFTDPLPVGQVNRGPSRPQIIAGPDGLAMVWKEFDGTKTSVNLMTSHDDGATWSKPRAIADTNDASDHPLLVSDGRQTYLSWMTKADGYHFQAIEAEP
ncbi:sialidase family protein [Bradyrhizobium lablabi]|uniref:sialidase family protein n=1 Tax=Bradyrhizobium lablabi TaxID=722472 RepID=UPI001BA941C8|nr:sialidase family protein [Bradyrhizobium lablabi]MBR0697524.1 exo-alpha-sialidase [Bradyrhizobium lablabi]